MSNQLLVWVRITFTLIKLVILFSFLSYHLPYYLLQPELSIRYYRRLIQMGVINSEVWNNIGLCCFFSSQYDMALGCFERALLSAADDEMSDLW